MQRICTPSRPARSMSFRCLATFASRMVSSVSLVEQAWVAWISPHFTTRGMSSVLDQIDTTKQELRTINCALHERLRTTDAEDPEVARTFERRSSPSKETEVPPNPKHSTMHLPRCPCCLRALPVSVVRSWGGWDGAHQYQIRHKAQGK